MDAIECFWVQAQKVIKPNPVPTHPKNISPHSASRRLNRGGGGLLANADPEVRSSGSVNGRHIYSSARPVMTRPSAKTENLLQWAHNSVSYNVSAAQLHRCVQYVGMATRTKVTPRLASKRGTNKRKICLLSYGCVQIKPNAWAM